MKVKPTLHVGSLYHRPRKLGDPGTGSAKGKGKPVNHFFSSRLRARFRIDLSWIRASHEGLLMTPELIIAPYPMQPPRCVEYDPSAAEVAQRVRERVTTALPAVTVEHIGSTAVPGCAGKGVVDLMVLYPPGELEAAKETLAALGFQPQTVGHLFPETRPMRVGALEHAGRTFRLHVHVIAADSPEAATLRAFRERLAANPELMTSYVERKRAILATGITDCRLYTGMKSAFVQEVLATG
jgi:GrpB-like predicted nucleotidyltransferase (UPF0157 family)